MIDYRSALKARAQFRTIPSGHEHQKRYVHFQRVAEACRLAKDSGWTFAFQWTPSHISADTNGRADAFGATAHLHNTEYMFVERFSEAQRLIA